MSKIWYIGDLHGKVDILAKIDETAKKQNISTIVQVGDFGIHWPPYVKTYSGFYALKKKRECQIFHYFNKRKRQNRGGPIWYTCGGNHDNWWKWMQLRYRQESYPYHRYSTKANTVSIQLAPDCYWIPRGGIIHIEGKSHIFFGGAESIDKHRREEFKDWWKEESPTAQEFDFLYEQANNFKPEIFVTHDCPISLQFDDPRYKQRIDFPTPKNFDNLIKVGLDNKPKHWFYGHHHFLKTSTLENIQFHGCGYHGQGVEFDTVSGSTRFINILSRNQFKLENWNDREYLGE